MQEQTSNSIDPSPTRALDELGGATLTPAAPTSTSSRKPKKKSSSKGKGKRRPKPTAATADKHLLYGQAVQSPDSEVEFLDRVYKQKYGRKPQILREDFCGTANSSCEWVRLRKKNVAYGVDLEPSVLEWARSHNLPRLTDAQRERVTLIEGDVRTAQTPPAEVLAAMNFSYFLFKTREQLAEYFRTARNNLAEEGLLVCDCYGGYEAQDVIEEPRKCKDFTYIWEQASFNPITNETTCHIHFEFNDGTKLNKAFTYEWRLWSIAEIRELMAEAGFARTTVYWEGTDEETDEGDGVFEPTETGEVCPGWIAYIVAEPH